MHWGGDPLKIFKHFGKFSDVLENFLDTLESFLTLWNDSEPYGMFLDTMESFNKLKSFLDTLEFFKFSGKLLDKWESFKKLLKTSDTIERFWTLLKDSRHFWKIPENLYFFQTFSGKSVIFLDIFVEVLESIEAVVAICCP